MSPHKDRASGTFILDRRIPPVGRIKVASGTSHPPTFRRLNEMLTGLKELGRFDILRAIKDRTLKPLVVYEKYKVGRLDELPTGHAAKVLIPALEHWRLNVVDAGEKYRTDLKYTLAHLVAKATEDSTIHDLPDILREVREQMRAKAVAFNLVKAAAQAFVRDTLGRRHAVYGRVADVQEWETAPKRQARPQTPAQLAAITAKMDDGTAAMAWSLAKTGMRPVEYWQRRGASWFVRDRYVEVNGRKSKAAKRKVPLVGTVTGPTCWEGAFREALATASDGQVQTYDLRRSYANWMEAAGIIKTRRMLYMGHSGGDVTSLYEWHEVEQFIAEDAAKLRAYIENETRTHGNSHGSATIKLHETA